MKKILVVEDDDSLRLLYTSELSDDGYEVLPVSCGDEALEVFKEKKPDLVVLDIKLTGMSGLEILGEMLKVKKDIHVVINSAYPNFQREFSTWGADAYLVKSSDTTVLRETVKSILEKKPANTSV